MNRFTCLLAILCTSCATLTTDQKLSGRFVKSGKTFDYSLQLNEDSTFVYLNKSQFGTYGCEGKWQYFGNDTILLHCTPPAHIDQMLQRGYMQELELQAIRLSAKKIKVQNSVLKKH